MAKNRLLARVFLGSLNCFPGFFRHDFAVMPVKKVSVNWTAKLHDSKDLPKYGDSGDGKFSKKFGEGRFDISAPIEVDALMKKVPRGRLTTINDLRAALSKKHKTDFACPITTGIFSWIAAHAADEMARQGPQTHHAVLAHAQERRPNQPEVSRRRRGHPRKTRGRRPLRHPKRQALPRKGFREKNRRPETQVACPALGQAGLMAACRTGSK